LPQFKVFGVPHGFPLRPKGDEDRCFYIFLALETFGTSIAFFGVINFGGLPLRFLLSEMPLCCNASCLVFRFSMDLLGVWCFGLMSVLFWIKGGASHVGVDTLAKPSGGTSFDGCSSDSGG
jgi:hypothetical protein